MEPFFNIQPWMIWGVSLSLLLMFMSIGKGYRLLGIVMINNDKVGVVTKTFALLSKSNKLPDGAIIALRKEAGFQADTLAPGLGFCYWPWQYSIASVDFVVIRPGYIGLVEARDGAPIPVGRVLAKHVDCNSFQDARAFLEKGGQRGMQMDIIPPGTFRINTNLFTIREVSAVQVPQGKIGLVTTLEGEPLPSGEIAGREMAGHLSFQNADAFVKAGGFKGIQAQVLMPGTYFINPLFAQIEADDLTPVEIGNVGVVVAFIGEEGRDTTGVSFTHGNIVSKGQKGVWTEPLDPGRYPINRRTHKTETVPTTNIVLNWATGKTEAHQLDRNLSTITVRSQDGFTFNLDVSQIIHVSRENAPKVIARFGNMNNLVTQVLEPTIGNYFRNSAQGSDVINFLTSRAERQREAAQFIAAALEKYNVMAVDTLIGDITPPPELMKTLTDRKVASQLQETFKTQQQAEVQRQELNKATAEADTRPQVIAAERAKEIAVLQAAAKVSAAGGDRDAKKAQAEGDAFYTEQTGKAEAGKTTAIGSAEAGVLKAKVEAVGADKYALMNVIRDLAASHIKLVPDVQVTGGDGGKSGVMEAFIGNLLATQAATPAKPAAATK